MYGPLPIPSRSSDVTGFPHNVVFRTANWVEKAIPEDSGGYDVVLAFVFQYASVIGHAQWSTYWLQVFYLEMDSPEQR